MLSSQKGSALIMVFLVCAVLLLLGTSLIDLNNVDMQISFNQRDSLQAYYLAETGMESVLYVLREYDPYYTGISSTMFREGNVTVSVSAQEEAFCGRSVTIISTGEVGRVREQISLQFQSYPPCKAGTDGSILGWYDETDGIIVPGKHLSGEEAVVLGLPGRDFPLVLEKRNMEGLAHFSATQLYFISKPTSLVLEETLELSTAKAVFQGRVILCPQEGSLHFMHPAHAPIQVYFRDSIVTMEQRLVLEAGVYHFPHGYKICGTANSSESGSFRMLPAVPGTMMRWGRR